MTQVKGRVGEFEHAPLTEAPGPDQRTRSCLDVCAFCFCSSLGHVVMAPAHLSYQDGDVTYFRPLNARNNIVTLHARD